MNPTGERPRPIVALASGGVESAVMLKELLAAGHTVIPCYVEAGLIWEPTERRALESILEAMAHGRLRPLAVLKMPLADCYSRHWSLTGDGVPDGESPDEAVELPGRNLLLLAKAAVYASGCGSDTLALGPLKGNPFPDATEAFFELMAEAAGRALGRDFTILTPLIHLDKVGVLERAGGVPLELTFSCISPAGGIHCGRCNKCAERARSFRRAGLTDPTTYKSPPP